MLTETLGRFFTPEALKAIIAANVWQDGPATLLGHEYVHFGSGQFKEALGYINDQHALISTADAPHRMWTAFGRLTHGAHDFYAHTNYVDLWLQKHGGLQNTQPHEINGLDPELLNSPDLRSAYFYWWRDLIYYVPGLGGFARKYLVFEGSHEAMHLDDPSRGPRFYYAIEAAKQRTLMEYQRAARALTSEKLMMFLGQPSREWQEERGVMLGQRGVNG
jgi:hypothetical protein